MSAAAGRWPPGLRCQQHLLLLLLRRLRSTAPPTLIAKIGGKTVSARPPRLRPPPPPALEIRPPPRRRRSDCSAAPIPLATSPRLRKGRTAGTSSICESQGRTGSSANAARMAAGLWLREGRWRPWRRRSRRGESGRDRSGYAIRQTKREKSRPRIRCPSQSPSRKCIC